MRRVNLLYSLERMSQGNWYYLLLLHKSHKPLLLATFRSTCLHENWRPDKYKNGQLTITVYKFLEMSTLLEWAIALIKGLKAEVISRGPRKAIYSTEAMMRSTDKKLSKGITYRSYSNSANLDYRRDSGRAKIRALNQLPNLASSTTGATQDLSVTSKFTPKSWLTPWF